MANTMNTRITDMTTGSPIKHILKFALPLVVGNIFQQLYNMVDAVIVGKYVGANALAAVGSCGFMSFFFFSLCYGLAVGIGVMISQYFGAKKDKEIYKTIANSVYVVAGVAVILSIVGVVLAKPLLVLLRTPAEILPDATVYLRTTSAGMLAVSAYNVVAQILQALGDSKTPLIFLSVAAILNIALDLFFVLVMGIGVAGVALATIIAQAVSAGTCIVYAHSKVKYFKIKKEHMQPDGSIIKEAFRLGLPLAVQSSAISISCIVLQGVVNTFGTTVVAAYTITGRVEQLVLQPYNSLGTAITTYTGQNIGANKTERVKKGFAQSMLAGLTFTAVIVPVIFLGAEWICSIFVEDPEVIALGTKALRLTCLCYFGLIMIYVPRAVLNGCKDAGFAVLNGATEVACRIGYSQLFTSISSIGYMGVWITTGATWFTTAFVCLLRYRHMFYPHRLRRPGIRLPRVAWNRK